MSRFFWLIRREIWEHKAIWVAPAIVLVCLLLAFMTGNVHLGPIGAMDASTSFGELAADKQAKLLLVVYGGLALVVFMVMGIVGFFYSLDSLYADRRDRSVLFWKSLPLSDAETVLSKFAVAVIVIPLIATIGALLAQLMVAGGGAVMLEFAGASGRIMWQPDALLGGMAVAVLWCVTAILWYSPVVAYLMLASAWAPKGPFLWAVLPPAAIGVFERVVLGSEHAGTFFVYRLTGLYRLLDSGTQASGKDAHDTLRLSEIDLSGSLRDFYTSADLWFGIVAAGLLLAAAMWVRRYRDETA
jgi:ABC-2 type transport system permease protein